jgi:autotransporter-associated beta strand protein
MGAANVIPSTTLLLGQNDANTATLDLNGFSQTVSSLASNPTTVGANTTGKSITSATPATLTVNQSNTTTYASVITGSTALVKDGAGSLTLSGTNTFTGNVTVNNGTLVAGGTQTTSLGSATTAGRTVTVNSPGTLSFATNNVYGNGVGNANLPTTLLNGSTLSSTRYNVIGNLSLSGATLTQAATDAGNFEGFQFRGDVTVTGTAPSFIATTNGKANHLGPNTTFNVADVTSSSAVDLLISTPLRNQSGDFGNAAAGLSKSDVGTLELSAANIYTGTTNVNGGTLIVSGSLAGGVNVNAGGTLAGDGPVGAVAVTGGIVAPGLSAGTLVTGDFSLDTNAVLRFELSAAGVGGPNDLISTTGSLVLDGLLEVMTLNTLENGSYRLIDYTGALTNNGLALSPAFAALYPGSFIDAATPQQVNLIVVPEPGALLSLAGGFSVLCGLKRFRRRN